MECEPLNIKLSADSCARRYRIANTALDGPEQIKLSACQGCPVGGGRAVEQLLKSLSPKRAVKALEHAHIGLRLKTESARKHSAATKKAMASKRAKGESLGAIPYGYQLHEDGLHLQRNEYEQRVVQLARQAKAEGQSLRQVGRTLVAAGLRPRSGGDFHPQTVNRWITTPERPTR